MFLKSNTELNMQAVIGIVLFFTCLYGISENRKNINKLEVIFVFALQLLFAFLFVKFSLGKELLLFVAKGFWKLKESADYSINFLFGYLSGQCLPFEVKNGASVFIFVINVLPFLILMSALTSVMIHLKILERLMCNFSKICKKYFGVSGNFGLIISAKLFLGQTEVPILVRDFVDKMTRSDLFVMLVAGFSTASCITFILYAIVLENCINDAMNHILAASIISILGSIVAARIVIPDCNLENEKLDEKNHKICINCKYESTLDALNSGINDGVKIIASIIGFLIVTITCVKFLDQFLSILPSIFGQPITLQSILSVIMWPVVYFCGIPVDECFSAAKLLSTKIVLNEFVAFYEFTNLGHLALCAKTKIIMTYVLFGFANFSSVAMVCAVFSKITTMRKLEISKLAFKAMLIGFFVDCLSGAIISLLI